MRAITVEPKTPGSARFGEFPEPDPREGAVLVEAIAVGVCGTDAEIVQGKYGWARRITPELSWTWTSIPMSSSSVQVWVL